MKTIVQCPQCGSRFRLPADQLQRQCSCRNCQHIFSGHEGTAAIAAEATPQSPPRKGKFKLTAFSAVGLAVLIGIATWFLMPQTSRVNAAADPGLAAMANDRRESARKTITVESFDCYSSGRSDPTANVVEQQDDVNRVCTLLTRLPSKEGELPAHPVRVGADEANIELTISTSPPLHVRRKIHKDGKSTLEIKHKTKEGIESKVTSPQKVLDALVGSVAFDPLAFTRMKPQEQVEILKRLVGVDTIDLNSDIEDAFEDRKQQKRELETYVAVTAQMPHYDELPETEEPLDPAEVQKEVEAALHNNKRLESIEFDVVEKQASVSRVRSRIRELQQALEDAQQHLAACEEDLQVSIELQETMTRIDVAPLVQKSTLIAEHNWKLSENKASPLWVSLLGGELRVFIPPALPTLVPQMEGSIMQQGNAPSNEHNWRCRNCPCAISNS
ncbi:hypothetical protein [Planctomicrobium sp. SH664]|uniref:hypothetical protein n=1 Tax=Planctomicrobium sp. SH664 TaxID=3448125 RepID=UPI003F5AE62B